MNAGAYRRQSTTTNVNWIKFWDAFCTFLKTTSPRQTLTTCIDIYLKSQYARACVVARADMVCLDVLLVQVIHDLSKAHLN